MATIIPRDAYPLSDAAGQAIPLQVVRSKGMATFAIASNAADSFTFTETDRNFALAVCYSDVDAYILFDSAETPPLIDGTRYDDAHFIPAFTLVTLAVIEGTAKIWAVADSGRFHIQLIDKWASINRELNAVRR